MRVGFRFNRVTGAPGKETTERVTLWSSAPGEKADMAGGLHGESRHGRISNVNLSYADFEISECKVTFMNPSEELVRALLAIVIVEPNPLDQSLDLLDASIWVQDTSRIGYEAVPLFHGIVLSLQMEDGPPEKLTVTLHDFRRLQSMFRDAQDLQNLTDGDIALMLFSQLETSTNDASGAGALSEVRVDPEALAQVQASSSIGSARRYVARLLDASKYEKLVYYAHLLGFKVTASVARHKTTGEAYTQLTFAPLMGETQLAAGTYRRGDGEVISFNRQYDPPGTVMTRDVNSKRFDPINEVWVLERASQCVEMDDKGIVRYTAGDEPPPGAIRSPLVPTDASGKPITLDEYAKTMRRGATQQLAALGWNSDSNLWGYHDKIAFRKGLLVPGAVPGPLVEQSERNNGEAGVFQENMASAGTLFWRLTGKLQVRFNPLLTTTDYLKLEGWGVWDGTWAIRSISHALTDNPTTTLDVTFGTPVRISG